MVAGAQDFVLAEEIVVEHFVRNDAFRVVRLTVYFKREVSLGTSANKIDAPRTARAVQEGILRLNGPNVLAQ